MMPKRRTSYSTTPLSLLFCAFALAFIILAGIGCYLAWSPVPINDMWDGYLGFYLKTEGGDWSAWWAQHNEHRILLSRILFWLDLKLFNGQGWFLLAINHLLMVCIGLTVFLIWRARSRELSPTGRTDWAIGFFLVALVSSWIQYDNLTWGFQSQFFLAQWIPLLAFYFLHGAQVSKRHRVACFSLAILCGVAALGSMANGVITLPLLTLYALLLRMPARHVLTLAVLSIIGICAYFYGYAAPGGHGSLGKAIQETPWQLLEYMLAYLGSPMYYIVGKGQLGITAAQVAGAILMLGAMLITIPSLRSPRQSSLTLAMLFFLLYIGGTALATAGGRLIFGIDQAVTSRYTTPALMAWAALIIASAPWWYPKASKAPWNSAIAMLIILIPLAHSQWKATTPRHDELFQRDVAALALELQVHDKEQIAHVFPFTEWVIRFSRKTSERNLSLFGVDPLKDLFEKLDRPIDHAEAPANDASCQGHLDEAVALPEAPGMLRIRGWIHDPAARAPELDAGPHAAHDLHIKRWTLADDRGQVIGFVLSGSTRPDVASAIAPEANRSGFLGYVRTEIAGSTIRFIRADASCSLTVKSPALSGSGDGS